MTIEVLNSHPVWTRDGGKCEPAYENEVIGARPKRHQHLLDRGEVSRDYPSEIHKCLAGPLDIEGERGVVEEVGLKSSLSVAPPRSRPLLDEIARYPPGLVFVEHRCHRLDGRGLVFKAALKLDDHVFAIGGAGNRSHIRRGLDLPGY